MEHMHNQEKPDDCPHCAVPAKKWHEERIYQALLLTMAILAASFFFRPLEGVRTAFLDYMQLIWWAILLGFLIGGLIDYFVPDEFIQKAFESGKKRTIIYAVLFGFLMSACSHGILAIAIELYKKGAPTSRVIAFLLASPWANLPVTILLFGFFGDKALFMIFSAIIIAIITGFIYQFLEKKGVVETNTRKITAATAHAMNTKKGAVEALKEITRGAWKLAKMVLWWILIGMLLASFARAFVPHDFFAAYLGASVIGLLLTLVFATIIEICSEGSAPIAFEIFRQTGAFGNSFVFLMAGVATDYTEIGLIWSNIGKRAAILLPVITVPQILLLGYLFNILF